MPASPSPRKLKSSPAPTVWSSISPMPFPVPNCAQSRSKTAQVKSVRMGLFASNPPVARIVLDLNSPQSYEVFPSGNSVIVKLKGSAHLSTMSASSRTPLPSSAILSSANRPAASIPAPVAPPPDPPQPPPAVQVEFATANCGSRPIAPCWAKVLRAIGKQTGASVSVPSQADQDPVVAHLGPASPREVLAALLNGAPYNVVLMGSGRDLSRVTSIVLTRRAGGDSATMPANYAPAPIADPTAEPETAPPVEQEKPGAPPPPQDTHPPTPPQ